MKNNRNGPAVFLRSPRATRIGIVLVILLLSMMGQGCAPSLVPIDRNELGQLKDQPLIHVVHYSSPSLSAGTATSDAGLALGGLMGAGVGIAIQRAEGEKLKAQCSLEDPSIRIRESVTDRLSAEMGITNFRLLPERLESDELSALGTKCGNELVMDFKTDNWTLFPEPGTQWTTRRYLLVYSIRGRLIRLQDSRVMWLGYCKLNEYEAGSTGVTWDELIANDCASLKAKIGHAVDMCAQGLTDQLIGKAAAER